MTQHERERRTCAEVIALREGLPDVPGDVIEGYAAIFNSETQIGDYFREVVRPGAFTGAVQSDDVRALVNHDPSLVLGRTAAGTLTLTEDAKGLRYRVTLPNTTIARDLMASIKRGDISQSSFAFQVTKMSWGERAAGQLPLRQIEEVKLFDVSPVTYPAYDATSVSARAVAEAREGLPEMPSPEPEPAPPPPPDPVPDMTRRKRWLAAVADVHARATHNGQGDAS